MQLRFWIGPLFFLTLILLVQSNPIPFLQLVAHLRRSFRQHIISRHGRIWAQRVADGFRKDAAMKGWDKEEIEAIIQSKWDEMVRNLGEASANRHIGLPHPIEKMF